MSARTVAAVDCGTNSIRLLVLRAGDHGVEELAREVRLARLGQGVDRTGEFHPEALARAFAIFEEFRAIIDAMGGAQVRVVATSAARDVSNRAAFEAGVRDRLGVAPDVISGDEEARLSCTGVRSGVEAASPSLVIDIGGGSTELITVEETGDVSHAISLNVGAVRVNERFLHADPPTDEQVHEARAWIGAQIDGSGVDFSRVADAIGVAGTVTSFAARTLGLLQYERDAIHETRLSRDDVIASTEHWLQTPSDEIAREPCMHPLRAQVIGGGALVLDELSRRVPGGAVLVSETDILDGIALELLEG
ncbi:Ppx/GppA phosphatase family protein [uncultured Tessaracoccus sp.]|uniref:Ppx/GppA phosphatase family protein n=1 Tax=uncultured Tessaracoccus sp. TaxID=905023 RepID=UPI0025DB77DB|nr:Ppx/GppA phosphatase family protein [uncultured Tessaracoccus sp.]